MPMPMPMSMPMPCGGADAEISKLPKRTCRYFKRHFDWVLCILLKYDWMNIS